ncbi:hypothetical protein N2152v2_000409 [Parachlorella kessleri]
MALDRAFISPTGLRFDRNWVITDLSGKMFTQREKPQLALVETEVTPPEALSKAAPVLAGAELVLRAPGMDELRVPLQATAGLQPTLVPVTVWDWSGQGADEGPAAAEWLTKYLGTTARLVRYVGKAGQGPLPSDDPTRRQVDPSWAPGSFETAFADGFPFLLANEASLEDLNNSMALPIPIDRFRPNLVVGGAGAWEEDSWQAVRAQAPANGASGGNPVTFELVKPCDRCRVPTIDQATGIRSKENEPTETLHRLRSGRVLGWTNPPPFKNSVFFAWNLVTQSNGPVSVGDSLEVVSRREGVPLPIAA